MGRSAGGYRPPPHESYTLPHERYTLPHELGTSPDGSGLDASRDTGSDRHEEIVIQLALTAKYGSLAAAANALGISGVLSGGEPAPDGVDDDGMRKGKRL